MPRFGCIIVLLLSWGCVTGPLASPSPKVVVGSSLDQPGSITTNRTLIWDYPETMPVDGIEFDLEHSFDLIHWSLYCRTNQPPVPFGFTNEYEFFRVGAHDD